MIFLPLIVILGVFSLLSDNSKPKASTEVKDNAKVVSVSNTIINVTDTDSDSVPDWEEIIWKTDPKKENTFGEPDREYINTQIARSKSATSTVLGPIKNSEDLTKELFDRYVQLQASGELNGATIESMTEDITKNIVISALNSPYTIKNIKTFPDSDLTQMNTYANRLSEAEREFAASAKTQLSTKPLVPQSASFQTNILEASKIYLNHAKNVAAIPTPQGLAEVTITYLNALKASAQGLVTMGNLKTDPLNSLLGLKTQALAESAQLESLASIISFLNQNGIIVEIGNSN